MQGIILEGQAIHKGVTHTPSILSPRNGGSISCRRGHTSPCGAAAQRSNVLLLALMYEVTIRKMYRHKDGTETLYEDPAQVRHERHAENLAARIARDPGVEWVEVEEKTGRFKASASRDNNGLVHEWLQAKGQKVKLKHGRPRRMFKARRAMTVIAILVVLTLLGLLVSR